MANEKKNENQIRIFKFLPLSLHLETLGGLATPLVLRGTPLPAQRSQTFSTAEDNQRSVKVDVYMGESPIAKNNIHITSFTLKGIPSAKRGEPEIKITFSVDQTCRIKATAVINNTDIKVDSEYKDISHHLSEDEVKRLLEIAEAKRTKDDEIVKLIDTKNRGSAILAKANARINEGETNDQRVDKAIAALGLALNTEDGEAIHNATQTLEQALQKTSDPFAQVFGGIFSQKNIRRTTSGANNTKAEEPKQSTNKTELSNPKRDTSSLGKIFGGGEFTLDPNLCFVLMPFSSKLLPLFEDHIRPIVQSEGLSCMRADEIFGTNMITRDIWERISRARFLIADLTGQNANVFYELGLAHALGKDVILLTQTMEDVPFDLKAMRCIVYEFTPRGMKELENKLKASISEIMKSS